MILPFFSPATLILRIAGPEGAKNLAGKNVLRLIQIRLTTSSVEKITPACQANSLRARIADSQFQKRRQFFIRTHNETVSVIPVRVGNEDCSPGGINPLRRSPNSNRLC
jgi:hypothetical protein